MDTLAVPDALSRDFDIDALNRGDGAVIALDPGGTITWVNDAWHRFARENGAPEVAAPEGPTEALSRDLAGALAQCANCRRVHRVGDGWHWIPAWVRTPPPPVSHGLCATCAGHYLHATRARRQRSR